MQEAEKVLASLEDGTDLSQLSAMADHLADIEIQRDALDEEAKGLREQLTQAMLSQGLQNFKTSAGRQPYLKNLTFFVMTPEAKSQIPEWLDSTGHGDLVQSRYVNPKTLESHLKKVLEAGEALPQGVEKSTKATIGFRGK